LSGRVQRNGEITARVGGEKFVILLPEIGSKHAYQVALKMRASIEALQLPHLKSSISDFVTISLGVASLTLGIDQPHSELLLSADEALYQAKGEGRNRVASADCQAKTYAFVLAIRPFSNQ
jgi:diguanylate cyclase (GGDEF)-like protein